MRSSAHKTHPIIVHSLGLHQSRCRALAVSNPLPGCGSEVRGVWRQRREVAADDGSLQLRRARLLHGEGAWCRIYIVRRTPVCSQDDTPAGATPLRVERRISSGGMVPSPSRVKDATGVQLTEHVSLCHGWRSPNASQRRDLGVQCHGVSHHRNATRRLHRHWWWVGRRRPIPHQSWC